MPMGEVKWFDPKKGYGFILGEDGTDIFVHYSSIQSDGFRTLRDGEFVTYELVKGDKGFHARNVLRPIGAMAPTDSAPPSASA